MGLLERFLGSWRKSRDLKRISRALATPATTPRELLEGMAVIQDAEQALARLVLADPKRTLIAAHFNVDAAGLIRIYRTLTYCGAGGWQRGHWVAASALAFDAPLAYVLFQTDGGRANDRNIWIEVAGRVDRYFERGEMGTIPLG